MQNGTMPTLSSQSKHSGQQTKKLHQTPIKAHCNAPSRIGRELEIIDVDDELQRPNGHAEMTHPEFHNEAQTLNSRGHHSLPPHHTQLHADRADTQKLSKAMQSQFDLIKHVVLEKLSQKRPIPLTGHDEEYKKIYQLLEATVTVGESNSMLLIGVRGSGKTTLVNQAIRELSREQKDNFHVVRLNGFIHTDDKLALRDIWRQLGREIDIGKDDDNGPIKSYADTLAMLLALLSHPSENRDPDSDDAVAKSVIFIIDEFDLFASHPRQTLLYNLLDIAQSRKAPIAVLGLTTRLDVTEGLEKRVKSRFSHRYVYLKLPSSLSAFTEIAKSAMILKPPELNVHEKVALINFSPDGARHSVKKKKKKKNRGPVTSSDPDFINTWNSSVAVSPLLQYRRFSTDFPNQSLFDQPSFLNMHIRPIYHTSKSIPALLSSLIIPISLLTKPTFTPSAFLSSQLKSIDLLQPPRSNLHLLASLSDAALALLISACRLTILHATDVVNFSLAYSEYVSLVSKARLSTLSSGAVAVGGAAGTRVWGREVCKGEWERLVGLGLLVPALGTAGGGGVETSVGRGGVGGMVRVDVALEEIPGSLAGGLTGVMERWCKQL
jgi:origin recognition complex subunit 4